MLGVEILVAVVVLAVLSAVVGAVRRVGRAGQVRRAEARVRSALQAGDERERQARMGTLAGAVAGLSAAEAGALVLASRRTFAREVAPVLLAALGHHDAIVREDASRALADLGSPGLRAAWQACDAGQGGPAVEEFLLRHPDWLFERLLGAFVAAGEMAVRRHERLWRTGGMRHRLELLRTGSDAVNALRAAAVGRLLGPGDGRAA